MPQGNTSSNVTISLGLTKITVNPTNVVSALIVLAFGLVLGKLLESRILRLSRETRYPWMFNEDTAKALHNMVVLLSLFYSLHLLGLLSYKIGGAPLSGIFSAIVVFYFSYVLARRSRDHILLKETSPESRIKANILYYTLITLAFFISLNIAGLSGRLSTLIATAGITGIVLGFASQTVIANFISGIFLYFDKPLQIGDAVRVDDVEGIVHDIHILSTRIRTWDGKLVRIPNEKLFNSNITNLMKYPARRVDVVVGIGYSEDASKAVEVIRRTLDEMPYVLAEPEPMIFVDELADSSVNISVRAWVPSEKWFDVRMEIVKRIKEALDREGIEIPFPQRVNWFPEPLRIQIEGKKES